MAPKTLKADKKKAPAKPAPGPSPLAVAAWLALSGGLVLALAFIAPEIALLTLGVMAFGGFVLLDMRKRRIWEKSTGAKIKTLNEGQDRMTREIERQRYDLMFMRDEIEQINAGHAVLAPTAAEKRPATIDRMSLDRDPIPAAAKPGKASKTPPPPANQDGQAALAGLSDTVVRELVHGAVREQRIDVFVQPILRLPQRKIRFYEVFSRIRARPGLYLPAARYMGVARQEKLMNDIDHLLLMQCLKTIRDTRYLDRAAPFFINVTPATLTNVAFMKQLIQFLGRYRELGPRLVLEIRQKDFDEMKPATLEILRGLGKLGCALSLDHVTNLDMDLKFLQVLKVRFVKVNAAFMLGKTKSDREFNALEKLKRKIEGNGIGFIVEKIESEESLKELLDFGINYGQGYLFGKPDLQGAYKQQAAAKTA